MPGDRAARGPHQREQQVSITAAQAAVPVSPDTQPSQGLWPARAAGGNESERIGFGAPFAVDLSMGARTAAMETAKDGAPDPRDDAAALSERLRGFREEVEKMLVQRGMDVGEAAEAAGVLAAAVGAAAGRPEIREQFERILERGGPGLAGRAALVVEEAVIRWDAVSGRFVPTVQRVAVSVDVENGYVVPRGAEPDLADPSRRIAVLKLDAALPLAG